MPGHRQPTSLQGLSLGRVCQQLDGTCRKLQLQSQESSAAHVLSYAKQEVRPYYLRSLPTSIRTRVIDETMRMLHGPASDGSSLISGPAPLYLLALLLGQDIKHLRVNLCCYYGCSHQTSLLKLLAQEGVGLESLSLTRSALLRLDCKLLRAALLNMKNLMSLTLRNIASDVVLQVVGRACPKLVVLDVAGSRQITDLGLKQLLLRVELHDKPIPGRQAESLKEQNRTTSSWSRLKTILSMLKAPKRKESVFLEYREAPNPLCESLRVLNIANTCVTSAGVLLALAHVPKLESLAEYSHLGRVVEIMNRAVIDLKKPFSLTQARSTRTTVERLQLLAEACPRVEKLHITEPHHPAGALRLFPYVVSLTLHGIPARCDWLDGFYDYLRTHGKNLKDLNLRLANSEAPIDFDLRQVFLHCPNLEVLTKDGCGVTWHEGPDPPALRRLKKIELGQTVSAKTIIKVLSLAPELTALHVHTCYDLTDEHLEMFFDPPDCSRCSRQADNFSKDGAVKNLNCFYVYEASRVSAATVLHMMRYCKNIRRIGNLSNWGLDCDGVRTLKDTLVKANLDVELCPGSHWFWSNCIR